MASASEFDILASAVPAYLSVRDRPQLSAHERNVAFLEAHHLRTLKPTPMTAIDRCGLSPSSSSPPIVFSNPAHTTLSTNHDEFFDATHTSFAEFTLLHIHLHAALLRSHNHAETSPQHTNLMPTRLTPADQILLWLSHLAGDRTITLRLQFGYLHVTTIFRYLDHVTYCVNEALNNSISWPTPEERKLRYGMMSVCGKAVAVLDGTHCPIQAPYKYNNTYYSGYKCKHTQNYLVCVDYLGMILHIDGPHPGRSNDREVYTKSDLYINRAKYLTDDEYILADGGFIKGEGLLVPIQKNTFGRMTDEDTKRTMLDYNHEFTANRLIVEDVFGWLKERVCVLNRAWPRDM